MMRWITLFLVCAACGLSADANPAPRCGADGTCPDAMFCHAGFCLVSEPVREVEHDAEATPRDAGAQALAPEDAATTQEDAAMSQPGDAAAEDVDQDGDENESRACDCKRGEVCLRGTCCSVGEILCDDECVNPSKDKDHCGGCDRACERGPCRLGICVGAP